MVVGSFESRQAPRAKGESFASAMAWSKLVYSMIGIAGPKKANGLLIISESVDKLNAGDMVEVMLTDSLL